MRMQEKGKQQEAEKDLLSALEEYIKAMDAEGPFFMGREFTITDIMLIPWLLRQPPILKEYKGFEIPSSGSPVWDRCAVLASAACMRLDEAEHDSRHHDQGHPIAAV